MPMMRGTLLAAAALLLLPVEGARAHGFLLLGPDDLWAAWSLDPRVIVPLLLLHWLYGRGVIRLWRHAGFGRGISAARAAAFLAGEAMLVLALVWPLDALGETLFSAHMVQHMLLAVAAPPLLVMGALPSAAPWALPARWRGTVARVFAGRPIAGPLTVLTLPSVASLLQTAALWGWHAPGAFEAARFDDTIHTFEHATLLGTALLFWWAVIHSDRQGPLGRPLAAFWTLVTVIAGGMLGALLTFAPRQLYPSYGDSATLWGISALDDQRLAGLIMWIPAGAIHLVTGVVLVGLWLRGLERHHRAF